MSASPGQRSIVHRTAVDWAAEVIATGFGSGLAPVAPATFGSLAGLVIYVLLPLEGNTAGLLALIAAGFGLGVWASGRIARPDDHDPRRAVIDEFVGMWAAVLFLPVTLPWMVAAFFLFRLLDILKPWPVRRLESLPGGWGIVVDDLAAGLLVAGILNGVRLAL